MNDKQIDRLLLRLEKEHKNELKMIHQFSIEYFETDYLEDLHLKWKSEHQNLCTQYKNVLIFALFSPIWLVIGFFASHFEIPYLPYIGFLLPISIFFSLNAVLYLFLKYGSLQQHDHLGNIMELELLRRRDRMYI